MKNQKKITNVQSFVCFGNKVSIVSKIGECYFDNILILKDEKIEKVILFNYCILFLNDLNLVVKTYSINQKSFIENNNLFTENRVIDCKNEVLYCYIRVNPRIYSIIEENKIVFNTSISLGRLEKIDNSFYDFYKESIIKFKTETEYSWEHKLTDKEDLSGENKAIMIAGVHNGYVFVVLSKGSILVLNEETGEEVKHITVNADNAAFGRNTFMHPENKHIYCLSHTFLKFNINTLEIEVVKEIATYKRTQGIINILYGINNSSYQGSYISFTSFTSLKGGMAKWIGLFDYHTYEIVWHYELLHNDNGLYIPPFEAPQLANGKLYVLDSSDTLHILEDEEVFG